MTTIHRFLILVQWHDDFALSLRHIIQILANWSYPIGATIREHGLRGCHWILNITDLIALLLFILHCSLHHLVNCLILLYHRWLNLVRILHLGCKLELMNPVLWCISGACSADSGPICRIPAISGIATDFRGVSRSELIISCSLNHTSDWVDSLPARRWHFWRIGANSWISSPVTHICSSILSQVDLSLLGTLRIGLLDMSQD